MSIGSVRRARRVPGRSARRRQVCQRIAPNPPLAGGRARRPGQALRRTSIEVNCRDALRLRSVGQLLQERRRGAIEHDHFALGLGIGQRTDDADDLGLLPAGR